VEFEYMAGFSQKNTYVIRFLLTKQLISPKTLTRNNSPYLADFLIFKNKEFDNMDNIATTIM